MSQQSCYSIALLDKNIVHKLCKKSTKESNVVHEMIQKKLKDVQKVQIGRKTIILHASCFLKQLDNNYELLKSWHKLTNEILLLYSLCDNKTVEAVQCVGNKIFLLLDSDAARSGYYK